MLALQPVLALAQSPPSGVVPPPPPAPPVPAAVAPLPAPSPQVPSAPGAPASAPRPRREPLALPVGELQTLEKITGRVRAVDVVVGEPTRVGPLVVTLRACRKRPQEDIPETAAFFEINEQRPGEGGATRLFTGWMFASSPAVSGLEHPVYDVWLVDCKSTASPASAGSTSTGSSSR
ncbi:MAG: DUF2155 domain-containing protein [Alphaproteobacteria bacterium]|nr:DUF2155 domain-containing protein [Alphaproteobacteria bacterium]